MPDTIGVGRVARDVRTCLPQVQAMAEYLSANLTGTEARRCRPVLARDNAEMVDYLRQGIVDVVSEAPMSAMRFIEEADAEILLRERRDGVAEYRSVVFVRKDSGIGSLNDLRGKRIAFQERTSTGAFLLPLAMIKTAGLRTVELHGIHAPREPAAVGYFFGRSELSVADAVRDGIADAGALNDVEWANLQTSDPLVEATMQVIARSERIPRSFVLVGPKVSPDLKRALKTTLLAMDRTAEGRAALQLYNKVERYDEIDASLEPAIRRIRELYHLVREEAGRDDAREREAR